jgi:hypothetical protein
MSHQNPNKPLFCAHELNDLTAFLIHDLISYITAISTGLDMRIDTWPEVAPLMRQSRDTLLAHMNVMRFMLSSSLQPSATGWAYVHKYGDAVGIRIQGTVEAISPWQAGMVLWCIKQFAHKTNAHITVTPDCIDIEGEGFVIDQGNVSVLTGHQPSTNPRQSLSRYLSIVTTDQGLGVSVSPLNSGCWRIHWTSNPDRAPSCQTNGVF